MKTLQLVAIIFLCLSSFTTKALIEDQLSVEQLRSDFKQLYTDLEKSHINLYENVSKKDYDAYFNQIYKRLNKPLNALQVRIQFQKFVAFGKVAHASIDFPNDAYRHYREAGGLAFPIYVKIDDTTWTVAENYSHQDIPKNARITHINGFKVDYWLETLHSYISADTSQIVASLLEFQLPQYLWLNAVDRGVLPESYAVTVKIGEKSKTYTVQALSHEALQVNIDASAQETSQTPALREYRLLSSSLGYLKPGPFYNAEDPNKLWDNTEFRTFIDNAFDHFLNNNVSQLVIDVRNNPGGTNSFSDHLIAWFATEPFRFASEFLIRSSEHAKKSNEKRLDNGSEASADSVSSQFAKSYAEHPFGTVFSFQLDNAKPREGKRFKGKVYVLINRSSYSNAVSLAAIVKDYGFGTIIGEMTTDFATTMASMETFKLKQSKITVGFPKALIIRPSGDKKPGPVKPDIAIDEVELDSLGELPLFKLTSI